MNEFTNINQTIFLSNISEIRIDVSQKKYHAVFPQSSYEEWPKSQISWTKLVSQPLGL